MGYFEDLYNVQNQTDQAEAAVKAAKKAAIEASKYNKDLVVVREIAKRIIARSRTQHPKINLLVEVDGEKYAGWSVYSSAPNSDTGMTDSFACLLSDGRLVFLCSSDDYHVSSKEENSYKNHVISLKNAVNGAPSIGCNIQDLRNSMAIRARDGFGVQIEESWIDKPAKSKGIISRIFGTN